MGVAAKSHFVLAALCTVLKEQVGKVYGQSYYIWLTSSLVI